MVKNSDSAKSAFLTHLTKGFARINIIWSKLEKKFLSHFL